MTSRSYRRTMATALFGLFVLGAVACLSGCGGSGWFDLAYLGGGLPPGEPDIGGVVVAAAPASTVTALSATTAQGDAAEPVVGAQVDLLRGRRVVGTATTGPGGYFRFENPDTGNYQVRVTPPAGSGLRQAQRQFRHTRGQQTFLTIQLERE